MNDVVQRYRQRPSKPPSNLPVWLGIFAILPLGPGGYWAIDRFVPEQTNRAPTSKPPIAEAPQLEEMTARFTMCGRDRYTCVVDGDTVWLAYTLDKRLIDLATRLRLTYSRYADDITFSSSRKEVPSDLVRGWEPEFGPRQLHLGRELMDAIRSSGFSVNDSKTRLSFQYERKEVTGLVVNRSANVWRRDISRMRMILHSAKQHGAGQAALIWVNKDADAGRFWQFVAGRLSFFAQVRGRNDPVVAKLCKLAVLAGLRGIEWIEKGADMVREFDVFLSHASEDKDRTRKLKDRLEALGVTVFFDESSISWGDSIVDKINNGLLKSSFFLPFLSTSFAKKGWTNKELNSAIAMNVNRKGRILPIKDDGFSVEDNYPLLNETLYEVWPATGEDEFLDRIADAILHKIQVDKQGRHDLGYGSGSASSVPPWPWRASWQSLCTPC